MGAATLRYDQAFSYDVRGNLTTQTRRNETGVQTDNLSYTLIANQNRLARVHDLSANALGHNNNGNANSGTIYGYDANGNITSDTYRGVSSILYNHLDLPTLVQRSSTNKLEMTYDASGNLLCRKTYTTSSTVPTETLDYISNIEYINNVIDQVHHDQGRYKSISVGVYRHEYTIADHLGNTRILYTDANNDGSVALSEILDENHYYAYGMELSGSFINGSDYRYKFNGIERVESFGMDFAFYRGLDPVLGRWYQVDPKAEYMYGHSPYNSMLNNPISYNDPNGDIIPVVAAAIVGGIVGAGANIYAQYKNGNLNSFGDWVGAGVIGGVAGGVGAVVGTAAIMGSAAFAAGGAAAAGATGVSVGGYTLGTTGAVSGAISGAVGGTVSSPLRQIGNMLAGWQDEFSYKEWLGEAALGFGVGGAVGGLSAAFKGQNFWWGNGTKIIPTGGIAVGELENVTPTALDGGWNKLYSNLDQSIDYAMKPNKFDHILYGSANSDHGLQNIIQENFRGNNKAFMRTVLNNMSINNSADITLGQVFKNVRVGIGANQVFARGFATSDGILKLSGITIRPY